MRFVATLEHTADNCWARAEHKEVAREWLDNIDTRAEEHGVSLYGSYVAPNEHRFYMVMEAERFEDVSEFLGPPFLQDHAGDITPVIAMGEVADVVLDD